MPLTLPSSLEPLQQRLLPGTTLKPPPLRTTSTPWRSDLTPEIEAWCTQNEAQPYVCATLHLLNDDVEKAHEVAQGNEGVGACDLCHAILHRREGDYWNSKWWLRQIRHPVLESHYGGADAGRTEAQAYVDAVEAVCGGGKGGSSTACGAKRLDELRTMQCDELAALLKWSLENS